MKDIKDLFRKVNSYLINPLPEDEIIKFQERIGCKLPSDFLNSLKLHNGSKYIGFCRGSFFSLAEIEDGLLSQISIAKDIFGENEEYVDTINIKGPIKRTYWSRAWIPFFCTDWSTICIDLDPSEGGSIGQIIEVNRETRDLTLVAKNYMAFLEKLFTDSGQEA